MKRSALGIVVLWTMSWAPAGYGADASFPAYRDAKMEQRWQADRGLVREPSPGKGRAAMARARAAVRGRDRGELEAAARDLVVHAPDGVAAGWSNAAAVWAAFSKSSMAYGNDRDNDADDRAEARSMAGHALGEAAYGLYAAYRSSSDPGSARKTLGALSKVQEVRGEYVGAELALLGSLTEGKDPRAEGRLNRIRNEHGFRVLDDRIDNDRDDARVCLALSAPVAKRQRGAVADYVAVTPSRGDHPVVLRESMVCIGNLEHGAEYRWMVRDGLTDVHGRTVVPDEGRLLMTDRPARASFAVGRYVLPKVGSIGVPLTTVNMEEVFLSLLRITEGNLVGAVMGRWIGGSLGRDIDTYDISRIVGSLGELEWQGAIAVKGVRNRKTVTAVPVDTLMPERKPGVYLLVATDRLVELEEIEEWPLSRYATQWLVVSDIGLTTVRGADGLSVFARSLATAEPMAGVSLALQARNEDTLAETVTNMDGRAAFAPGLLRGSGGREAVLLRARSADDDHTFLSLAGAGFDLADRGADGRPAPGPVDAYLYTDRGIYRPGEVVHLTALVRDDRGRAVSGLPLRLAIVRPDGVPARDLSVRTDETGAVPLDHLLADTAVTGVWRFELSVPDGGATVGETAVEVKDFVPPRIEVDAEAPEAFAALAKAPVTIAARFLYGAPAAGLAVRGRVRVEVDPEPFADWSGYRFGLVEEQPVPARAKLPDARTGEDGVAVLSLTLPAVVESTHPLRARVEAAVLERGGRPVGKAVVRPLRDGRERVGIRPRFTGAAGIRAPVDFEVALVDGAGEAVGGRSLVWRLYRESREPFWYRLPSGRWEYREIVSDSTVDDGEVRSSGGRSDPARVTLQADWGAYRLEVADPGNPGALPASVRFLVGWGRDGGGPGAPDRMTVRLDRDRYLAGDAATVRLEAPFDGAAMVTVLTDRVAQAHEVEVVDGKATLSLPVEDWTAGAYVAATVFRPAPVEAGEGPGRAVGLAWLAVEQPGRRLSVALDAPEVSVSGGPAPVAFRVTDGAGVPTEARLTLAAVDEGILQMTGFETPDPTGAVFGKRRMGVDLRDLYGRLIDSRRGRPGVVRSGGDDAGGLLGGVQPPRKTVALYHGLMRTDAEGRGEVVLDVPEGFHGRLRLMAVAHTKEAVGHGRGDLVVRDPLVADFYGPRFLAPGDEARVTVELVNTDAPAGSYTPTLSVAGPAGIAGTLPETLDLSPGERWSAPLTLSSTAPGDVVLRLGVSGPGGAAVERTWTLPVRPAQAWRTTLHPVALGPGGSVRLSGDLVDGLYAKDARVSVGLSAAPYDLHGLLASLDRYPYGCTEQTISRALPLLYVKELRTGSGPQADDPGRRGRIQGAVRRVLSRQRPDGGFGLWSARYRTDPWISAYALDFLDRARAQGFEVDAAALQRSRSYVANLLSQRRPSRVAVEAAAYGLAVLARSKSVDAGVVRRFVEARLGRVATGLGRAQVALAAASFGLKDGVDAALAPAAIPSRSVSYGAYGSELRDAAALVSAAAALDADVLREAGVRLRRLAMEDSYTSTQEKAWMVVAAWELNRAMAGVPLAVDGVRAPTGPGGFHRVVRPKELEGEGLSIANMGDRPVELMIGVGGHPATEEPAHAKGVTMERTVLTWEGAPVEPGSVKQGDELIVVLEGRLAEPPPWRRRLLVADLLPAGLEIRAAITDNEEYEFLEAIDRPGALRLRDDRYVAALDQGREKGGSFRLAYLVRAVTPGTFRVPAPYVEDMYDPRVRARGAMGSLEVRP